MSRDFLSLANIKFSLFSDARDSFISSIMELYTQYDFLRESSKLTALDKEVLNKVRSGMSNSDIAVSLKIPAKCLFLHYNKKVLILLDEYDTPMVEDWMKGYWDDMADFMRSFFNATFKTNH